MKKHKNIESPIPPARSCTFMPPTSYLSPPTRNGDHVPIFFFMDANVSVEVDCC